ncbi:unnamed protein product [Hydatigera taeniaeformis]|uniref:DUF1618 domain-containing protein n=1 Tax=Hydatigena taeniaeformis TaxID=6205 RepID=A0A0R3WN08_HYDTA|nr:unnamed protein product [Hydatigera taeniaeformis]
MEVESQVLKAFSEPDNLDLLSRTIVDGHLCQDHPSASSSASLLSLDPHLPISDGQRIRRSYSAGHLIVTVRVSCAAVIHQHAFHTPAPSSGNHPDSSIGDGDDDCNDANDASPSLQYERFGESSLGEGVVSIEGINYTLLNHMSIPRRREFSEQFRDLAQLHRQVDVPRAKWDDASRLFPKQFGLPPSVALSICVGVSAPHDDCCGLSLDLVYDPSAADFVGQWESNQPHLFQQKSKHRNQTRVLYVTACEDDEIQNEIVEIPENNINAAATLIT